MADTLTLFEHNVLGFLSPLRAEYPDLHRWFITKVVPGKKTGERRVFTKLSSTGIVAVGIAKSTPVEKKICTLYVAPEWRKHGFGGELVERMLDWLGTMTPIVGVMDSKLDELAPFVSEYGWKLTSVHRRSETRPYRYEYIYNEVLFRP